MIGSTSTRPSASKAARPGHRLEIPMALIFPGSTPCLLISAPTQPVKAFHISAVSIWIDT